MVDPFGLSIGVSYMRTVSPVGFTFARPQPRITPRFEGYTGLKVFLGALVLGGASLGGGYALNPERTTYTSQHQDSLERLGRTAKEYPQSFNGDSKRVIEDLMYQMQEERFGSEKSRALFVDLYKKQGFRQDRAMEAVNLSVDLLKGKSLKRFTDLQPVMDEFADQYFRERPEFAQRFKAASPEVLQKLQSESTRENWAEYLFIGGIVAIFLTLAGGMAANLKEAPYDVGIGLDGKPVFMPRPEKGSTGLGVTMDGDPAVRLPDSNWGITGDGKPVYFPPKD
jgi:hypothetical protein